MIKPAPGWKRVFYLTTKKNIYFFGSTGQVFIPKIAYIGQKLTKLVSTNIPANTISTMPNIPVIMLLKNKIATTTATIKRIILSVFPTFFFIVLYFS